jgi:hypothetical protein
MSRKRMMLTMCSLLVSLAGMAQEVNHERRVDILPADDDSTHFSDPAIRDNMEKWLNEMPTVVARHPNNILEPIEPDFLSKVALKDEPNFPKIDWEGMMSDSKCAETNFQLGKMGQWWQNQKENQAGGAMMIGVTVKIPISVLMRKIFPDKKRKRRERLQKILDEY